MTDYARLYAGLLSESDPRTIPKRQDKGPITQYHAEDLLRAPYDLLESGEVRLSLYYPAAKKVEIEGHMFACELHIDGDYHTGTCRVPPGFHPLKVFVDGSICFIIMGISPLYGTSRDSIHYLPCFSES